MPDNLYNNITYSDGQSLSSYKRFNHDLRTFLTCYSSKKTPETSCTFPCFNNHRRLLCKTNDRIAITDVHLSKLSVAVSFRSLYWIFDLHFGLTGLLKFLREIATCSMCFQRLKGCRRRAIVCKIEVRSYLVLTSVRSYSTMLLCHNVLIQSIGFDVNVCDWLCLLLRFVPYVKFSS